VPSTGGGKGKRKKFGPFPTGGKKGGRGKETSFVSSGKRGRKGKELFCPSYITQLGKGRSDATKEEGKRKKKERNSRICRLKKKKRGKKTAVLPAIPKKGFSYKIGGKKGVRNTG